MTSGRALRCRDSLRLTEIGCSYETVNNEIVITLRIDNIVEEDDAVYLCQVKVGINDMITKRVKLNVKTPVRTTVEDCIPRVSYHRFSSLAECGAYRL